MWPCWAIAFLKQLQAVSIFVRLSPSEILRDKISLVVGLHSVGHAEVDQEVLGSVFHRDIFKL